MLSKSVRIHHMDAARERTSNVSIGAAVLAGAASFVISFIALEWAALNEGLIRLALFNTHSAELPWVTPAIVSGSFIVAGAVAWLVFRLLRNKIHFQQ
jgi:hypothetical protein